MGKLLSSEVYKSIVSNVAHIRKRVQLLLSQLAGTEEYEPTRRLAARKDIFATVAHLKELLAVRNNSLIIHNEVRSLLNSLDTADAEKFKKELEQKLIKYQSALASWESVNVNEDAALPLTVEGLPNNLEKDNFFENFCEHINGGNLFLFRLFCKLGGALA